MFTDPALTAAWACSWGRLSPACIYPDWLWLLPGLPLRHPIGPRVGCVGSLRGLGHRSATATAQGQGSCQPHSGPHPPGLQFPRVPHSGLWALPGTSFPQPGPGSLANGLT